MPCELKSVLITMVEWQCHRSPEIFLIQHLVVLSQIIGFICHCLPSFLSILRVSRNIPLFLKTESGSFLPFVTFIESFSYPLNTIVHQRNILDFHLFFLHIEFIMSIYGFIDQLHLHERQHNTDLFFLRVGGREREMGVQVRGVGRILSGL